MGRAFAEHWKGVVAGLVVFNVGLMLLRVFFPPEFIADSGVPVQDYGPLVHVVMESQATAVVENPYGLHGSRLSWLPNALCAVLVLLASGATAAGIGARVVAWRGALVGVLGTTELWALAGFFDVFEAALGCSVVASLTYAGGGLAKLLAWARTRAA